jgi:hypothetical protein
MGASASSVRAGEAFVELYVKNNLFTRGLKAAGDKLKNFGKFADGLVGKAAGLAGLVAAPVGAALKEFVDLGTELTHSSERLGTTVEQLDAMRFAAEQAGVATGEFEGAAVRLNRVAAEAPGKLEKLGVSAKEFTDLTLEERFQAVAQGVADLKDETQRTAAVMDIFGRGGAALLPMFKDGAEGIGKATAEAKRLGLVMSGDDARQAAELGKSFHKLEAVIKRTFMQLGAALLPVFEKIKAAIDEKLGNLQSLQAIIRQNSGLILSALKVAKTVLKVAAAWAAFRAGMTQAGNAISLVSTLWGAFAAILGFVVSPLGIIVGSVVALGALFLTQTDAGRQFTSDLGDAFEGLQGRATAAWGGIKDALSEGDLGLAAKIAWAEVVRESTRVWKVLRLAWTDVVDFFGDGWDSFVYVTENIFNMLGDFIEDAMWEIGKSIVHGILDAVAAIQDTQIGKKISDKLGIGSAADLKKELEERDKAVEKNRDKERFQRDKDLSKGLDKDRDKRKADRDQVEKNEDQRIADADAEIADLIAQAAAKKAKPEVVVKPDAGPKLADIPAAVLAAAVKGTFSGFAAGQQLGVGGDVQKKQLDKLNDIDEKLGEIAGKDDGLAVGQ